jgi:DNA mismatch repair protein MutS2
VGRGVDCVANAMYGSPKSWKGHYFSVGLFCSLLKSDYLCTMIYPSNFEHKVGFDEIRALLKNRCLSPLGKERVDAMEFSTDHASISEQLEQVREFRRLQQEADDFPLQYFFDVRQAVQRIRLENTHLEEQEVWDLRRSLETIINIVKYLSRGEELGAKGEEEELSPTYPYPALHRLTEEVVLFPAMVRRIDSILDKFGKIKDSASMSLASIRHELAKTEGSISRTLYTILHAAQKEGLVDKDAAPTMRDGRLVIPVAPNVKKRIGGIVHDESATGKTVFVEPAEVVEANNKVRQLEAEERREVIRILTVFSDEVRPHVREILGSYELLAAIDFIYAKASLAELTNAMEPQVTNAPHLDWIRAIHPLLDLSLQKKGEKVVPLDIMLTHGKHLLVISGPNAGGKSVCLKTVGLLQYMLQCGLSIPVADRSSCGIFKDIMIDIGDEQSIENDLSTYSSHLMNMKVMMKQCTDRSLLLIDEFGGGTEPMIGGAIAESMLNQFWKKRAFGVITTHYQNLKHFAEDHEGVVNGAMLYDRKEMKALFQLSIGQPGSSFAIEIARKTGIPEEVIRDASEIVGQDYIQSDKYLQDIVRDKRYWEGKRQTIHQHEKSLEGRIAHYEESIEEIERERKEILRRAKEQAEELLRQSNRKIENAIREIRESQAEKEAARKAREELNVFKMEVADIDTKASDEMIEKKMRQIQERRARHEQRMKEKAEKAARKALGESAGLTDAEGKGGLQRKENKGEKENGKATPNEPMPIKVGSSVRIKGLTTIGQVESLTDKTATVIFGGIRSKMKIDRLEVAAVSKVKLTKAEERNQSIAGSYTTVSAGTRNVIDSRRTGFRQDLDIRGMRGDEALTAVTYYLDDAILVGMSRVRILHGTGTGALRQLVRQYLSTVPNVINYHDEHVQFGGAGITVVDLD